MKKRMKNRKGFTLIELIVVIAILGILAAILIPRFGGFQDRARATQALTDAKQIATAMDALYAEKGDWTKVTNDDVIKMAFDGNTYSDRTWVAGKSPDDTKNGSFYWQYSVGTKTYIAGRSGPDAPVEMSN